MKSAYERKKFIGRCIWISAVLLLILGVWLRIFCNVGAAGIIVSLACVCAGCAALSVIGYRQLDSVYDDVEKISSEMAWVTDHPDETTEEEFRQGSIGILYTNFYKMVSFLRESREKEKSEKLFLRDIISDISHQMKTPLASLNIYVDVLLDGRVSDEDRRRQMLTEAQNQLSRMEWMVLSLLKLARIEAGVIEFNMQKWDVEVLLAQAAEGVRYLTDKKGQSIQMICESDLSLCCDGDWLTEALINLLKNASDYSGEGTTVTLEVEHNDMFMRIYVKDKGMGIPESELPHIFKRFYRVNQEVNPNSVGIGLSLAKSIVEGMGGRISVRSKEGEYTWFMITFMWA